MKNSTPLKIMCCILYLSTGVSPIYGQRARGLLMPDTIIVYDTIRITDTIRIQRAEFPALHPLALMPAENIQLEEYRKFSLQSATLRQNCIIEPVDMTKNKKTPAMKKALFFSGLFLTLQNILPAQHGVYITAGTGIYALQVYGTSTSGELNVKPAFTGGIGYQHELAKGKLFLTAELNYHYQLHPGYSPAQDILTAQNFSPHHQQIAVPLAFRLQTRSLSPSIGAEFYYRKVHHGNIIHADVPITPDNFTQFITIVRPGYPADPNPPAIDPISPIYSAVAYSSSWKTGGSLFAGLDYPLGKQLAVSLNYFRGFKQSLPLIIHGAQAGTRLQRLELRLKWKLY